jgi:hypothetical protein
VRLRALPLLLVLTAADYALWDWSIANGHDILSLIAGLTLLPLAAATVALIALGAARLLGFALARPAAQRRRPASAASTSATPKSAETIPHEQQTSRRLAA